MIGATIEGHARTPEPGGTLIYKTKWFLYCVPAYRFRVVVQSHRSGAKYMKGVITAYEELM